MYALVQNGVVVELYTPPSGYTISQCFPASLASQFVLVPSGVTPAQGWTYSNGTFAAPAAVTPSAAQQSAINYAAWIAAGLNITFTSTPALTGTYAIDQNSQQSIIAENVFISQYATFTNGSTNALVWPLLNNTTVTFPSITEWNNFAKGVAQQVAAANLALIQNASMPSGFITVS